MWATKSCRSTKSVVVTATIYCDDKRHNETICINYDIYISYNIYDIVLYPKISDFSPSVHALLSVYYSLILGTLHVFYIIFIPHGPFCVILHRASHYIICIYLLVSKYATYNHQNCSCRANGPEIVVPFTYVLCLIPGKQKQILMCVAVSNGILQSS